MKNKPIMFTTKMVEAILKGQKTQTRRIMNPQPILHNSVVKMPISVEEYAKVLRKMAKKGFHNLVTDGMFSGYLIGNPIGRKNDILYVKETFAPIIIPSKIDIYVYKASHNGRNWAENSEDWKWKPSLFMPAEAARIFLKIKDVRYERLNMITEEDAKAEGVESIEDYKQLWNTLHEKKGTTFEDNPAIFVYDFSIHEIKYNDYE